MPDRLFARAHFIDAQFFRATGEKNNFQCPIACLPDRILSMRNFFFRASQPVKKIIFNARSPWLGGVHPARIMLLVGFNRLELLAGGLNPRRADSEEKIFCLQCPIACLLYRLL